MIIALPILKFNIEPSVQDIVTTLPGGLATFASVVLMCLYDKNVGLNVKYINSSVAAEETKERFLVISELLVKDHLDMSYVDEHENNVEVFPRCDTDYLYPFLSKFYDLHKEHYEYVIGSIAKQTIRQILHTKCNQYKVFIQL